MHLVVAAFAVSYAVAGTFGAWSVVRRRRRLAAAFMVSAGFLTVGAVASWHRMPETWWFLFVGVVAASLAAAANAVYVLRRVHALAHVARALFGAVLVFAAWWAFVPR